MNNAENSQLCRLSIMKDNLQLINDCLRMIVNCYADFLFSESQIDEINGILNSMDSIVEEIGMMLNVIRS